MASFILSGNAGAGEFWPLRSEAETVARFQITPRATIDVDGECEGAGCIVAIGSQFSGFIKDSNNGVIDTRLYLGTGNRNFEFSITAGYTHLFGTEMLSMNDGFVFGGAIEFNPIFFITRQPIWLTVGYDCRLLAGGDDFTSTHMVWAGLSLMLDWLWNPGRYA